jgi:hypothetical protein
MAADETLARRHDREADHPGASRDHDPRDLGQDISAGARFSRRDAAQVAGFGAETTITRRSPMPTLTDAQRDQIDNMSHIEMCRTWQFARRDDPIIAGAAGGYLYRRLQALGGFTPDISRQIGWDVA